MGIVWKTNSEGMGNLVHPYPEESSGKLKDCLVNPSQAEPTFKLAGLSEDEVITILKKLDSFAPGWSPQISLMFAEGAYAVIQAVRLAKYQSQQNFRGIFAQGGELDLRLLRPKDVGGAIMSSGGTSATGLYAGTGAAVYTWLNTLVVNTTANMIPQQTMLQWAAQVYLGFIDPIEVPPIEAIQFKLYTVSIAPQPADFKLIKTLDANEIPVVKLEKPIIIPPLGQQYLDIKPYRSGDSKIQPISVIVARAQDLTL